MARLLTIGQAQIKEDDRELESEIAKLEGEEPSPAAVFNVLHVVMLSTTVHRRWVTWPAAMEAVRSYLESHHDVAALADKPKMSKKERASLESALANLPGGGVPNAAAPQAGGGALAVPQIGEAGGAGNLPVVAAPDIETLTPRGAAPSTPEERTSGQRHNELVRQADSDLRKMLQAADTEVRACLPYDRSRWDQWENDVTAYLSDLSNVLTRQIDRICIGQSFVYQLRANALQTVLDREPGHSSARKWQDEIRNLIKLAEHVANRHGSLRAACTVSLTTPMRTQCAQFVEEYGRNRGELTHDVKTEQKSKRSAPLASFRACLYKEVRVQLAQVDPPTKELGEVVRSWLDALDANARTQATLAAKESELHAGQAQKKK
jgi:hypothetical protein